MGKRGISLIVFIGSLSSSIVFASTSGRTLKILRLIARIGIKALAWFGVVISIGVLIFLGIKYLMSSANERANLKGKMPTYITGVGLIVLCSVLAGGVAKLAGNEDEKTIMDKATELSGLQFGVKKQDDVELKYYKSDVVITTPAYVTAVVQKWENGEWHDIGTVVGAAGNYTEGKFNGTFEVGKRYRIVASREMTQTEKEETHYQALSMYSINGERFMGWDIEGGEILYTKGSELVFMCTSDNTSVNMKYDKDITPGEYGEFVAAQFGDHKEYFEPPADAKLTVAITKPIDSFDHNGLEITFNYYETEFKADREDAAIGTQDTEADEKQKDEDQINNIIREDAFKKEVYTSDRNKDTRTEVYYLDTQAAGGYRNGECNLTVDTNHVARDDNVRLMYHDGTGTIDLNIPTYSKDEKGYFLTNSDGQKQYVDGKDIPYEHIEVEDGVINYYGDIDFNSGAYTLHINDANGIQGNSQIAPEVTYGGTVNAEEALGAGYNPNQYKYDEQVVVNSAGDSVGYIASDLSGAEDKFYYVVETENGYDAYEAHEAGFGYLYEDNAGNMQFGIDEGSGTLATYSTIPMEGVGGKYVSGYYADDANKAILLDADGNYHQFNDVHIRDDGSYSYRDSTGNMVSLIINDSNETP